MDAAVRHVLEITRAVQRNKPTGDDLTAAVDALTPAQREAYFQRTWPVHVVARTPRGQREYIACVGRPL
jgi:hypothetical protein